jgi:DNA (cytosine-5)-methyltransferase 1
VSDGFSPTLRAGSGNRTAARPIHYEHARVITVREAARLHSFPDWFDFGTSKLAAHKAIGNSVPPLLAYAIASQVWAHLEEILSPTIILRCPAKSRFMATHLLELQTAETSVVILGVLYSTAQQPRNMKYGIPALVGSGGENIKVDNERSPPVKISSHPNIS